MILEISKVSAAGSAYQGDEPSTILQLDQVPHIRLEGPVSCHLFAQVISRELIVQGKLEVPVSLECSRCAEFFSTILRDSSFLRVYKLTEGLVSVDLTEDIRESILLEIPPAPHCSSDCKGLCPHCGTNLNRGTCNCRPSALTGRWSDLDKLNL